MKTSQQKTRDDVVTQDYTINLRKRTHKITFKKKAPRAIREIKKFAQEAMGTKDVRVDPRLNQHVWSTGVRKIPGKIRVRLSRKTNEDEDADEKLYTLIEHVNVSSFEGLATERV